jgi:hypothetical protein
LQGIISFERNVYIILQFVIQAKVRKETG